LVESDLPESELTVERLSKEAQVLFGAGTVSSARTLDFLCYYIIANDNIRERLEKELEDIMADYPKSMPTFVHLQKLEYLSALVKEGLR
jgi:cytochrome P450